MSETLGSQLRSEVVSLARRQLRRKIAKGETADVPSGDAELAAFRQAPGDRQKGVVLAEVMSARANADDSFKQALASWWEQAKPVRESIGDVTNTITGGTSIRADAVGPGLQRAQHRCMP